MAFNYYSNNKLNGERLLFDPAVVHKQAVTIWYKYFTVALRKARESDRPLFTNEFIDGFELCIYVYILIDNPHSSIHQ